MKLILITLGIVALSFGVLAASAVAGPLATDPAPSRDFNLQIEPFNESLLRLHWNEDPAASRYRVYLSGNPLAPGDPAWLPWTYAYVPSAYIPNSPAKAFFYVSSVYDDLGTLTYIPGGTFNNGTSNVTISSFYLDRYEVTQGSYQAVMGGNPAHNYGVGDNFPAYFVDWFNAIEYCNRRSIAEGIAPCYSYLNYGTDPDGWPVGWDAAFQNHTNVTCAWSAPGYRLATEMEWMFAARGGNLSHNYTYSGSNDIAAVAWYDVNANETHQAGTKAGNELSLFDMSGNVREWCWDISANYPTGAQTDPTGPTTGTTRVKRGGSFWDAAAGCAVTYRSGNNADVIHQNSGFRVCRRLP